MFLEISDRTSMRLLQQAKAALGKRGQDWNRLYVATATPGRYYAREVTRKGREVSAVQQAERMIVAPTRELGRGVQEGQPVGFTAHPGRLRGMNLKMHGESG